MEILAKKVDKKVTVIINGQEHSLNKEDISYEEIVNLAFNIYENKPEVVYTVLYFKGNPNKAKGELVKEETVKVKEGMIFNVTKTDRS